MPILIDTRGEGEADIAKILKNKNLAVELIHLESGDIVFGNVGIERKTISDLVNSVTSGSRHLWTQIETLRNTYEQAILLIEGTIDTNDRLLMGTLTTIILFWKYQIIFTKDKQDTATWIERLFTKYGIGKSNRIPPPAVKKAITPEEVKLYMLQCVDGIGPVMASKILKQTECISLFDMGDYSQAFIDELEHVKGLNKKSKEVLIKVFTE